MSSRRVWLFAGISAVAIIVAAVYTIRAIQSRRTTPSAESSAAVLTNVPTARPYLIVRSTLPDATFRRLVLAPLSQPMAAGHATPIACERAYFAAGRGVCLLEDGPQQFYAEIFDEAFVRRHRVPLTGTPSRARVSPDGRRAAMTVFEKGHSYADAGFSTRTTIVDTDSGRELLHLEQLAVTKDGAPFQAIDFNYWGVTFARDGNRFYATLATAGVPYLIEGDVDRREARVLRSHVECPSLSPDNQRIAYKHSVAPGTWQLRVLDLPSGMVTPLASESRSVDDQVEWLDDGHLLYHITGARGADIWLLPTDGGAPKVLREYAYSPSVVR